MQEDHEAVAHGALEITAAGADVPREPSGSRLMLPYSGQVTLAEVLDALRRAPTELHSGEFLEMRVVAIPAPSPGDWAIFAGELQLGSGTIEGSKPDVVSAGHIRLVRWQVSMNALTSEAELWRFTRSWYGAITSTPDTSKPQTTSSIERLGSRGDLGNYPGWRFPLYALSTNSSTPSVPMGPFYSRRDQFFAATIGEAAAQWLERPSFRRHNSLQNGLFVIVPDQRAFFADLSAQPGAVAVTIGGTVTPDHLSCAALFTDAEGAEHQRVTTLASTHFSIERPDGDLRRIQLYLLSDEGERLDDYYEDEHRCSRAEPILNLGRHDQYLDESLEIALERGEGETVEFKETIPLGREHAKSLELLQVVAAFANSHGGQLYIGITDNVVITGMTRYLTRQAEGDLVAGRAEYAKRIGQMIREGISPAVGAAIDWLSVAGHDILRVTIGAGGTRPHSLVESGEIYVRRGASCAKARPSDLAIMYGRDPHALLRGLGRR